MNRAEKQLRIPHEAAAVLDEITTRLKEDLRESLLQGQCRLEKEFRELTMHNKTHSEFRARFEEKIEEMDEYQCKPSEDSLFRQYVMKIPTALFNDVTYRDWTFPGDQLGTPQRQPEVANVIRKILQNRADAKEPHQFDTTYPLQDSPGQHNMPPSGSESPPRKRGKKQEGDRVNTADSLPTCSYCGYLGHTSSTCPSKYVHEVTGDGVKFMAAYNSKGKCCQVCGAGDHRAEHHELAAVAKHQANQTKGNGKNGGKDGARRSPSTNPKRSGKTGKKGQEKGDKGAKGGGKSDRSPSVGREGTCRHCNKPLTDKKAHPDGRACAYCYVCNKLRTGKAAHPDGQFCKKTDATNVATDPSSPKGNGKTQTPKRGGAPKGGKGDKPGPKAHPKGKAKGGLISTQHDTDAGMVIADGVDAVSRLFDTSYNAADWTSSMTLRELCLGASPDSAQADKVHS